MIDKLQNLTNTSTEPERLQAWGEALETLYEHIHALRDAPYPLFGSHYMATEVNSAMASIDSMVEIIQRANERS